MGAKMKGLYKGLRYFSNMFDPREPEMQIGYPTDVKHVAHIGWDGPSENTPSWMNDFRSAPLAATVTEDPAETPKFPSSEFILIGEPSRRPPRSTERTEKPSRRKKSSEESVGVSDSPKREASTSNYSRRRQSTNGGSGGNSIDGTRRCRRESRGGADAVAATASGESEGPAIPKQSHRRRTKGSSSSGTGEVSSSQTRFRANRKDDQGIKEPPPKAICGKEEVDENES